MNYNQKQKEIIIYSNNEWFEQLVFDIKKIEYGSIIISKWFIGKIILENELKFQKPEYGNKTIEQLAKNTEVSSRELWRCLQFAKKCHDVTQFKDKSWRWIVNRYLPVPITNRKSENYDLKLIKSFDENIFYISTKTEEELNCLCIDNTRGKKTLYKKYYPTITTQSLLYHPNGYEFSLRDYAKVQDFPENYKFCGSTTEIKKQIGNAVSPKMSEYIINKHILGKTFIDLFSGCGGFSLGAEQLKKECKLATDYDKYSGYSYKMNFPRTKFIISDIKKLDEKELYEEIGNVDFIIGGCPCQGFSFAGKRLGFKEDERNQLYLEFLRFIKKFQPNQFILENVPGILTYKEEIIKDFEQIGYSIKIDIVNGLDIGMKQKRKRVFFIGNKQNG